MGAGAGAAVGAFTGSLVGSVRGHTDAHERTYKKGISKSAGAKEMALKAKKFLSKNKTEIGTAAAGAAGATVGYKTLEPIERKHSRKAGNKLGDTAMKRVDEK